MNNKSTFIIENGVLESYNGFSEDVIIPDGVTEIGFNAFGDCENLTSVTVPEGVERIGDCAFWNCKKLKNVVVMENVELGDEAFPDEVKVTLKNLNVCVR